MAQLAIASVGGVVGSFFGAPGVGWAIGSIAGRLLFPPSIEDQFTEGPRLGDLSVTTSAYGAPLAIGYGTVRLGGSLFWSGGIEELKVTQSEEIGGKGGASATSTSVSYEYYASFAIAFAEGEADEVLRIWADGKLLYSAGATAETELQIKNGLQFRFYHGSETQAADALITDDVTDAPAYRGTVYLVFERLPLIDFGNRIPNITAEIAFSATRSHSSLEGTPLGSWNNGIEVGAHAVDWERGFYYQIVTASSGLRGLARFQIQTMISDRQEHSDEIINATVGTGLFGPLCVAPDGNLIVTRTNGTAVPIVSIDGNTWKEIKRVGTTTSGGGWAPNRIQGLTSIAFVSTFGNQNADHYILLASAAPGIEALGIYRYTGDGGTEDLKYIYDSDTHALAPLGDSIVGFVGGKEAEGFCEAWFISLTSGGSQSIWIYKVTIQSGAAHSVVDSDNVVVGVDVTLAATIGRLAIGPSEGSNTIFEAVGPFVDDTDGGLIFGCLFNTSNTHYIAKWHPVAGLMWRRSVTPGLNSEESTGGMQRIAMGRFGWVNISSGIVINTLDGSTDVTKTFTDLQRSNAGGFWDSYTQTYVSQDNDVTDRAIKWRFNEISDDETTVGAIVGDLCERSGFAGSDYDVADLEDTIPGYVVSRNMSARAAIEPLMQAYFFDGVESDYVLTFPQRPQSVARSLVESDLLRDEGGVIEETRIQEVELPERFEVVYIDEALDYEQGSQYARRMQAPHRTMRSQNKATFNIAAVFSARFAKRLAEKSLYASWNERRTYSFRLPWRHLDLDPADVLDLDLDNGVSIRQRLTRVESDTSLALSLSAIGEDLDQYASTVDANAGDGNPVDVIAGASQTRLLVLDVPLLRDRDEPPGRATAPVYAFAGGYTSDWLAATLYKSADDLDYSGIGRIVSGMTWGVAIDALGDAATVWQTDEDNTLKVSLITGELSSTTTANLLEGANAAALIKANGEIEVLQFRDVAANADGTHSLTGLLRGRRGTDTMAGSHGKGEIFVLLTSAAGQVFQLDLAEVDALRYYRGVSAGMALEEAFTVQLTSTGRSLMPYAPAHVAADLSGGDITISWVRRTRVGGDGWANGTGQVPLGEDSESYEIDIIDTGSSPEVVRTLTSSSESAVYTSAQISADFGSPPATLTVEVYQMSAQVGRGFSYRNTVTVT